MALVLSRTPCIRSMTRMSLEVKFLYVVLLFILRFSCKSERIKIREATARFAVMYVM